MRLLKIGRDAACDIVLHSDKVSSLHAELTLMNSGDIMLEDKGSRNGTFIMNQAIKPGKPVNVRRGDAIRFADVELQWSQVPMPEDNSAYKAVYGIGSHFNNDIQISGGTVSRYHATIKVGRDNKVYIIDHSKNGTTVDGAKIPSNNPIRIKKKSAVVCGGVPVNLQNTPIKWPSEAWKTILLAAACLLVLVGIGFGAWKIIGAKGGGKYDDKELFARFNHSTVIVKGIYHYEVSIGDLDMETVEGLIPQKVLLAGGIPIDVSKMSQKEFIDKLNEITEDQGLYTGTAFFISPDGKLITNLHVVKPWLFDNAAEQLKSYFARLLAQAVANMDSRLTLLRNLIGVGSGATDLSAYISQVKVEGILDYIALVPQGEIFDPDNVIKCRVLSAGEDTNKDVALIQTITKQLPTKFCTYVNVTDSMDVSEETLKVGEHIFTIGFPHGMNPFIQVKDNDKGIQAYSAGGSITSEPTEFNFSFDAASYHGASGSAVFNDKGMLIGVLNSGLDKSQGYNKAIKAKYVKELLDNPYRK
jgi:pSer/pThr/pTyr-binding forkhead associated (FHA) protein/S1-C subfamily serine protease